MFRLLTTYLREGQTELETGEVVEGARIRVRRRPIIVASAETVSALRARHQARGVMRHAVPTRV